MNNAESSAKIDPGAYNSVFRDLFLYGQRGKSRALMCDKRTLYFVIGKFVEIAYYTKSPPGRRYTRTKEKYVAGDHARRENVPWHILFCKKRLCESLEEAGAGLQRRNRCVRPKNRLIRGKKGINL